MLANPFTNRNWLADARMFGDYQSHLNRTCRRHDAIPHVGTHDAHHDEPGFWRNYIFSTDHKVIGIQYGITALCFLLFGFFLMLMMRWQIAHPGEPVPVVGPLLAKMLGDMAAKADHFAGPLQFLRRDARHDHGVSGDRAAGVRGVRQLRRAAEIGAPDMAFPRVNMASYQAYVLGGVDHVRQLLHSRRRGAGGLDFLFAAGDVDPDATARRSGSSAWCSSSPRRCWAR